MKQRTALKIMRCYARKQMPHLGYSHLVERASRALRSWTRRGYLPPG